MGKLAVYKLSLGKLRFSNKFLVGDTEGVLLNAKSALEKDGHTLLPFEMPDGFKIMNLMGSLSFADLGVHLVKNW